MIKKENIVLLTVLLGLLFGFPSTLVLSQDIQEIRYCVKVFQPAINSLDSSEVQLVQLKKEGVSSFYIDVESVSCGDNQCNIVPVRIYYDELGFYNHIELKRGIKLEKAKGKRFRKSDYLKLDIVLKNKKSALARLEKEKLIEQQANLDGVDAVSGATTSLLPEESYVKGAVWTCFSLWHWTNSDLYGIIRNITGNSKSNTQFISYLEKEGEEYRIFALEQVLQTKNYEKKILEAVFNDASLSNINEQKLIINYFEKAPPEMYFHSMLSLLNNNDINELRIRCLNSLLNTKNEINNSYCRQLSSLTNSFTNFQEINLLMNILEKNNCDDSKVNREVIELFERNDVIIGRRAYWFLHGKNLSPEQQRKIDEFYTTHSDYF